MNLITETFSSPKEDLISLRVKEMTYTKHLAHSINATYYFGTALRKRGAVTGQVANWGHSSGRKKDKFSSLQALSYIISYMTVFMGPKV